MIPAPCATTAPVPPPAYHRAQAKLGPALHVDALSLVSSLHLLVLWRLSCQDLHDWLVAWPALAWACGLPADVHGRPYVPSASQQCQHAAADPLR